MFSYNDMAKFENAAEEAAGLCSARLAMGNLVEAAYRCLCA